MVTNTLKSHLTPPRKKRLINQWNITWEAHWRAKLPDCDAVALLNGVFSGYATTGAIVCLLSYSSTQTRTSWSARIHLEALALRGTALEESPYWQVKRTHSAGELPDRSAPELPFTLRSAAGALEEWMGILVSCIFSVAKCHIGVACINNSRGRYCNWIFWGSVELPVALNSTS